MGSRLSMRLDDSHVTLINDLPDDILALILAKFSQYELMKLQLVCQHWNDLIKQDHTIMKRSAIVTHHDFMRAITENRYMDIRKYPYYHYAGGFETACRARHKEIVQLILSKGSLSVCWTPIQLTRGLETTCRGGQRKLVHIILNHCYKWETLSDIDWKSVFNAACQSRNLYIITLVVFHTALFSDYPI